MRFSHLRLPILAAVFTALTIGAGSQAPSTLKVTKIDPPNWYAQLPEPMLLVRGEGFSDARFSLSDPGLRIERTDVSANGHWAFLWLAASPAEPESIRIHIASGAQALDVPYTFAARRSANAGLAGFSSSDVMYLIMTDRFADGDHANDGPLAKDTSTSSAAAAERAKPRGWHGGDLRGITQHLDYLQQLGITAVWPTPVYQNLGPEAYHGYHCTDYYDVDPHYGTLAELQTLAAALHKRGMKLVLDTVPNHVGPFHPWVHDEPTPAWFHGTLEHHSIAEYDFQKLVSPHASARDRAPITNGWFVDLLPDMNTDDPTVALYLRQNAVWWLEQTGADGLRIDTFGYVNRGFWQDFNGELKELYPRVTEVGEVFDGNPQITSFFAGDATHEGIDTHLYTPFDFPFFFAARDIFAKGAAMTRIAEVLAADALYPHPERLVTFFGNHDTSRFAEDVPSPAARRSAFALLMTTRGTPQIYSGDEISMPGGGDPDDRRDFPGGFPAAASDAFTAAGRTPDQQATYAWIARLAALRRAHPALACGGEQILSSDKDTLVYVRDTTHNPSSACATAPDRVVVALHRGKASALTLPLAGTWLAGCTVVRVESNADGDGVASLAADTLNLQMAADGVLIASCR